MYKNVLGWHLSFCQKLSGIECRDKDRRLRQECLCAGRLRRALSNATSSAGYYMLLCTLRSWRELAKRRRTQRKLERTKASGCGSECPWWYQGSEVPFFLVQLAILCCGGAPSRGATAFFLPHHGSAVAPCCGSTIGRGNAQAA